MPDPPPDPPPDPTAPPLALRTYLAVRIGVVAVIVALAYAVFREISDSSTGCVQRSLSAYYYTPVRPVFVGALLIIGFAMIVMWGKTWLEDAALNLAGLLLAVVALVPTLDANFCSLPSSVRDGVSSSETSSISDRDLIAANADAVRNSFSSLLFVLALVLVLVAVVGVLAHRRLPAEQQPDTPVLVAYAVTWGLAVVALVVYWWLFQDADDPDSAFTRHVHAWSANIAVGLVILAAFLAARERKRNGGAAGVRWARSYTFTGGAMVVSAVVVKGGDAIDLFDGWAWLDAHATFVVEAILIALIGAFWVLQTIERRNQGAPTYA